METEYLQPRFDRQKRLVERGIAWYQACHADYPTASERAANDAWHHQYALLIISMSPLQKHLNTLEHEISWIETVLNIWHDRFPRQLTAIGNRLRIMRQIIGQLRRIDLSSQHRKKKMRR